MTNSIIIIRSSVLLFVIFFFNHEFFLSFFRRRNRVDPAQTCPFVVPNPCFHQCAIQKCKMFSKIAASEVTIIIIKNNLLMQQWQQLWGYFLKNYLKIIFENCCLQIIIYTGYPHKIHPWSKTHWLMWILILAKKSQ